MSKKSWPIPYGMLLYKMDQDFLDRQYINNNCDIDISLEEVVSMLQLFRDVDLIRGSLYKHFAGTSERV